MSWTLCISNYKKKINMTGINFGLNFNVTTNFSSRFTYDKAYFETDQYVVILDGIVLNSIEMKQIYQQETIADTIIAAYKKNGDCFMNELRGSFNGAFYDKAKNKWIIFVSHCGDRPLFYYKSKSILFVSSDFNEVVDYYKKSGKNLVSNKKATYYILTYGYMIDDSTHIEGINRLMPGDFINIKEGKVEVKPYYRFKNSETLSIDFDDAVDKLDFEFRKAINRIFDKDLEYGYKTHIADMSGGLDSRMVSWVANNMGYDNITNICYAQSQSKEWKAALNVANALGNDFIYTPLDRCNFIYDIDKIISMNYGLAIYAGITGGMRILSILNNDLVGLEMTGQLGDVIVGSYIKDKPVHNPPNFGYGTYSNIIKFDFDRNLLREYDNMEMFTINKRGLLGILSTHLIRNNYIDVVSPFLDVDFFSFCLSLPLEYRFRHKLYHAWIVRKYPNCADIVTSNYNGPVKEDMRWSNIRRKLEIGPGYVSRLILRKCGINIKGSPASMNPMDYWYMTDLKVREFINNYYNENKMIIPQGTKLLKDIDDMFKNGTTIDKLLVLTVLAVYKNYDLVEV